MQSSEEYEKVWNLGERKCRIGRFYVGLAAWLLGGHNAELQRYVDNDPGGDLYHFGLGAVLEVKGANNSHAFPVYKDQLAKHLADARRGFPVSRCFYVFFKYKDREQSAGIRRSYFAEHGNTQSGIESVLARKTEVAYIVDAEIIERMEELRGVRYDTWMGVESRSFIPVSRSLLEEIASDARTKLPQLGLPHQDVARFLPPRANRIKTLKVQTVFRRRMLTIDVVPIVPLGQRRLITKFLNGTVIPT